MFALVVLSLPMHENGDSRMQLLEGNNDVRRQIAADDRRAGKMNFPFRFRINTLAVPAVDDFQHGLRLVMNALPLGRQKNPLVGAFE